MNARRARLIVEALRRARESSERRCSHSGEQVQRAGTKVWSRQAALDSFASSRTEMLRAIPGPELFRRDALASSSQETLEARTVARDESIRALRDARSRLEASTAELTRAIALERAAARRFSGRAGTTA